MTYHRGVHALVSPTGYHSNAIPQFDICASPLYRNCSGPEVFWQIHSFRTDKGLPTENRSNESFTPSDRASRTSWDDIGRLENFVKMFGRGNSIWKSVLAYPIQFILCSDGGIRELKEIHDSKQKSKHKRFYFNFYCFNRNVNCLLLSWFQTKIRTINRSSIYH